MATTLLAELTCLTTLVNNKFIIVDIATNTYKGYYAGRYTKQPVPKEFNPEDYALVVTDRYSIVVDATDKMKEKYLVNKLWKEQCTNKLLKYRDLNSKDVEKRSIKHSYKIGDRIHLKEKGGIYTIHEIISDEKHFDEDIIRLTCSIWTYTDRPIRSYPISSIKCLAGGIHLSRG